MLDDGPDIKIEPECRYGHGRLMRVKSGTDTEWMMRSSMTSSNQAFSLRLFICQKCGYTELFDAEPKSTMREFPES